MRKRSSRRRSRSRRSSRSKSRGRAGSRGSSRKRSCRPSVANLLISSTGRIKTCLLTHLLHTHTLAHSQKHTHTYTETQKPTLTDRANCCIEHALCLCWNVFICKFICVSVSGSLMRNVLFKCRPMHTKGTKYALHV